MIQIGGMIKMTAQFHVFVATVKCNHQNSKHLLAVKAIVFWNYKSDTRIAPVFYVCCTTWNRAPCDRTATLNVWCCNYQSMRLLHFWMALKTMVWLTIENYAFWNSLDLPLTGGGEHTKYSSLNFTKKNSSSAYSRST